MRSNKTVYAGDEYAHREAYYEGYTILPIEYKREKPEITRQKSL